MRRFLLALVALLAFVVVPVSPAAADQAPIYGQAGDCRYKLGFWSNLPEYGYVQAVSTKCSYISVQVYAYIAGQSPYGRAYNPPRYYVVSTHLAKGNYVFSGRAWACDYRGNCSSVFGYRIL